MKKHKLSAGIITAVLLIFWVSGCAKTGQSGTGSSAPAGSTAAPVTSADKQEISYTEEDLDAGFDASAATSITLNGSSMTIQGNGAKQLNGALTISAAGTYILSGTLNSGRIVIDAGKNDTVRLVLNNASVTCTDSAPVYCKQAGKLIITLADGSANALTDGASYAGLDSDGEPNAAVFSKADLTINGGGSLAVKANYNNGVCSKDDLYITGGTISIDAANDGLKGRDSVCIKSAALTIKASGGDGIQSNNDTDTAKGVVAIDGGSFAIDAANDGIQAATQLQITGGTFDITTGGGSANASTSGGGEQNPGWGNWGRPPGGNAQNETSTDTASAKALKAGTALLITGGAFTIDSSDDALHSNGSLTIDAGTLTISSGDDGIHADSNLTINGGTVTVSKSYEGLEGATISINGGTIKIKASDDGLNSAGGNDSSSMNGRPGQNNFDASENNTIAITNGYLYVDASGDGIDSNGSITMSGGTVLVNGPTNDGNGALDYGLEFRISGGILVAAGSAGMAQSTSSTSSQLALQVNYSATQRGGTAVNLSTGDGVPILTFAPSKDYQSIVISAPALTKNETYVVSSGGTASGTAADGYYAAGSYSGGSRVVTVTLTGVSTGIMDTGSAIRSGGGMR